MSDYDLELLKIEAQEKRLAAKRVRLEGDLKCAAMRAELDDAYASALKKAEEAHLQAEVAADFFVEDCTESALRELAAEEMKLAAEKNKLLGERKLAALRAEIKQQVKAAEEIAAEAEKKLAEAEADWAEYCREMEEDARLDYLNNAGMGDGDLYAEMSRVSEDTR